LRPARSSCFVTIDVRSSGRQEKVYDVAWSGDRKPGQAGQPSGKIVVTPGQVDHLKAQFTRTWQQPPTEMEVKGLIDEYVLDEISCREALAMRLDRDDHTIRRRLRLNLETLNEDIAAWSGREKSMGYPVPGNRRNG